MNRKWLEIWGLVAKIRRSTRSVSFLNSFFSSLVGMLSFMVLVRILSPEEFGYWVFFLSIYTMLDMIRSGLLGGATIHFYTSTETEGNLSQIEKSVLQLAVRASFLSFLIPLAYFIIYGTDSPAEMKLLAYGIVPLTFVSSFSAVSTWVAQAKQSFHVILKTRMISQLSFLVFLLSGFLFEFGLAEVFAAYFISNLLSTLYVLVKRRVSLLALRGRSKLWEKQLLSYGKFSMGTILGGNLLRNSDTYIIMALLSASGVAIYNVPNRILALLDIPLQAFSSADHPRFVDSAKKGSREKLQSDFNKGIGLSLLVVWPAASFVLISAEWVVYIIAGSQYENSVLILRIFTVFAMLLPLDRYSGLMLDALGMPSKNMIKMVVMLISNVVLDILVLNSGYGVNAVAAVSVATYSVGIVLGFTFLNGKIRLQIVESLKSGFELFFLKSRKLRRN